MSKHASASRLREGDMVVTQEERIGLLTQLSRHVATVAFGADGPQMQHALSDLDRATIAEIKAAGLWGVGCNQMEEK